MLLKADISFLQSLQQSLRLKILAMYYRANAGHIGSSLSCIDLLIALLFKYKRKHDDFILSKGHAAVALYACLHQLGEITDRQIADFYTEGSSLPAHQPPFLSAISPFATGSLGHGFPIAAGIAKAHQLRGSDTRTFVVMSDGDVNAGTTHEAALFASKHQLNNLILLIDNNKLQGFGKTFDVLGDVAASVKLWQAWGFDVYQTDGHDINSICNTIEDCISYVSNNPRVVIANTVKGKGVSYMENALAWHYLPMNEQQYNTAIADVVKNFPPHT